VGLFAFRPPTDGTLARTRSLRFPAKVAAPFADRPRPPHALCREALLAAQEAFAPAPEVERWLRRAIVGGVPAVGDASAPSPLLNPDHRHLDHASIGVLWTNVAHTRQGRVVLGTAELPAKALKGSAWAKGRQLLQLRAWFGGVLPDFLITLSAPYAAQATDAQWCALVEHELYHCAQARGPYGVPRFSPETGMPLWAIRGHDVEEFAGVVARYGADVTGTRALVDAAIAHDAGRGVRLEAIAGACGTCLRAAA